MTAKKRPATNKATDLTRLLSVRLFYKNGQPSKAFEREVRIKIINIAYASKPLREIIEAGATLNVLEFGNRGSVQPSLPGKITVVRRCGDGNINTWIFRVGDRLLGIPNPSLWVRTTSMCASSFEGASFHKEPGAMQ